MNQNQVMDMNKVMDMARIFSEWTKSDLEQMMQTLIEIIPKHPLNIANHEMLAAVLEALVQKSPTG